MALHPEWRLISRCRTRTMRAKVEKLLDAQKPTLLVGTPMCTACSTWQFINDKKSDPKIVESDKKSGRVHLA